MTFKCPAFKTHVTGSSAFWGAQVCSVCTRCGERGLCFQLSSMGKLLLSIKTSWSKLEWVTKVIIRVDFSRHPHLYSAGGPAALGLTSQSGPGDSPSVSWVWVAGQHLEVFGVRRCTPAGIVPTQHCYALATDTSLCQSKVRGWQAKAIFVLGTPGPCWRHAAAVPIPSREGGELGADAERQGMEGQPGRCVGCWVLRGPLSSSQFQDAPVSWVL